MKIYRVGAKENLLGFAWYVVQRKLWLGWIDYYKSSDRQEVIDIANGLRRDENNIVVFRL